MEQKIFLEETIIMVSKTDSKDNIFPYKEINNA